MASKTWHPPIETQEKLLTLNEVHQYLKIPKSTIYKLSQKGQIPSSKIGKQLRFRKSSLEKWLNEKENFPKNLTEEVAFLPQKNKGVAANHKQILLIDDDPLVLKAVAKFLKVYGFNVVPAQSGEEALEKVKKFDFAMLIADIRMPGMDGIEAIKRIRELSAKTQRPGIPEIVITGYADSEAEREAGRLGITDIIYKPFAIADFIRAVKKKLV